jgi:hypothetical protein
MSVIRNSAKCDTCDVELESSHVHDLRLHTCPNKFVAARQWVGDQLVEKYPREAAFNWGVDGGHDYVRRLGSGFTDTSIYSEETENGKSTD